MQEFITYTEHHDEWYKHRSLHYGRRALIMGVCRRWYNITVTSSPFWTSFAVGAEWGDETEDNIGTPSRDLLEMWLQRSQSSRINLYLHVSDWSHSGLRIDHVLATLAHSIDRWGLLEITLDRETAPIFLSLDRDQGYALDEIRICTACSPPTNSNVLRALGDWPVLETLVWTLHASASSANANPTFHDVITDFPWARLRNISLEVIWTLNEFHTFFRCCTMAVSIRLQLQEHPNGPDYYYRPLNLGSIKLEQLRRLAIQSSTCFYNYVQYLDLPNLDWISISQRPSVISGTH
ncbi:hypothetical protein Agabi119p4_10690 [Agaricus bisporus var. burnettii]|uniref:F-box domain-containing protein n=1 Tax=Agaricus bisporus var. burnettii TaxID=192524 RepID=A0A8H7C2P2_AGABI|nr:hypothetical protein Agabi119p4_10690 [Agaricus bisporus var. burnettii]